MNKKREIARAMAVAYQEACYRDEAVKAVLEQFPEVYESILEAMWLGIDAHDDLEWKHIQEHCND